jgi:hypothetical protein
MDGGKGRPKTQEPFDTGIEPSPPQEEKVLKPISSPAITLPGRKKAAPGAAGVHYQKMINRCCNAVADNLLLLHMPGFWGRLAKSPLLPEIWY